jgi:hypothetical protein
MIVAKAPEFKVAIESDKITISGIIEVSDAGLANWLKRLSEPQKRNEVLKALRLGGWALQLDDKAVFLSRMEKELDLRLSELRLLEKDRDIELAGSASKGAKAETDILSVFKSLARKFDFKDEVLSTGNDSHGKVRRVDGSPAKLGDGLIVLNGDGPNIVIESKVDKDSNYFEQRDAAPHTYAVKHVRTQSLGGQANRSAEWTIFVADKKSAAAGKLKQKALDIDYADRFILVKVDQELDDWAALEPAYLMARAFTLGSTWPDVQQSHLRSVSKLLLGTVSEISSYGSQLGQLKSAAESITSTAEDLLGGFDRYKGQLEKISQYLLAVMTGEPESALDLKIRQINLLTENLGIHSLQLEKND